jgi:hypothetical protein
LANPNFAVCWRLAHPVGNRHVFAEPEAVWASPRGIVIGAGLTFGLRILVSYSYKRDKRLHDRFVATPSDDGIEVSSSTGSSKFTWNAFTHQRETKSLFLLFQGPICVNIIPKSGLSHDEALAFRKLIQENLSRGIKWTAKA